MKGHCPHGEFELLEGCKQCVEEWRQIDTKLDADKELLTAAEVGEMLEKTSKVIREALPTCEEIAERFKVVEESLEQPNPLRIVPSVSTGATSSELVEVKPPITALIKVKPETDVEVMSFYTEALKLQEYAEKRVIATIDDLKPATDDLSIIARVKRGMEEKRKDYLKPFQDHIKETNEVYKTLMQPIEEADRITRSKILTFQQEQNRKHQESG